MVADAAAHARCRARKIRNLILVEAPWSLAFFVRANWAWRFYIMPNLKGGLECSCSERIRLARIRSECFCCSYKLGCGNIKHVGKADLQFGLNFTKKRRHVPGRSFGGCLIKQALRKLKRIQLLAIRRIDGCKNQSGVHIRSRSPTKGQTSSITHLRLLRWRMLSTVD